MNEIIKQLSEKLSDDAVQRTKGIDTKKGYDTTGYGYQSVVDKFNEILGEKWGFDWKIIHEEQGKYRDKVKNNETIPGASYWDVTVDVGIWIENSENIRRCIGNHISVNYGDAVKGAITNGFKKTAAFWGVGRDAFAGTIDDDNKPLPGKAEDKIIKNNGNDMNTFQEDYDKLSDNIKGGFEKAGWTEQKIKAKCLWAKFDEEKLKIEIDKDLK